ncbi:UPF0104 family protein [Halostreptopolyspora alba]|uniref:UPF0104 family protein n=1 Tax=Halostreptopolyspora alba TaxID=2487137 RepID=A0A3N0E3E4_9ACTN|nr:UPF0104 family protein [Nocardiopsaceae bacterium YIM 96095]
MVVAVVACVGYALYSRWEEASGALRALSPWLVGGSVVAAVAGLGAQMLAWRAILADLGSRLSVRVAARVVFVGQLGKYLPGSVWAFVAQVELARDRDVARQRGITATVLAVVVTLTVNLAVAAATLPLVSEEAARRWWWVLALVPVLLVAVSPRVVAWAVRTALRLVRRSGEIPAEELERVSATGMVAATGWTLVAWLPLATHVWALVVGVGGDTLRSLPVAAGAYALAWTLGVLFVIAPAGVGVREAVLVVGLAPVLDPGSALVVAALSRLVMTFADVVWAGAATLLTGPGPAARDGSTGWDAGARGG